MTTRPHELYQSEYHAWKAMLGRCLDTDNENWHRYGGRGITVCQQWQDSFHTFLADMGYKPEPGLTLERVDNDAGYEPSNCRWATWAEQGVNRRAPVNGTTLTIGGVTKPLPEWAKEAGIAAGTLHSRVAKGYPEQAWLIKGHMPKKYWLPK